MKNEKAQCKISTYNESTPPAAPPTTTTTPSRFYLLPLHKPSQLGKVACWCMFLCLYVCMFE